MQLLTTSSLLTDLHRANCGKTHTAFVRQTLSACCQAPLLCRYNLTENSISKADLLNRPASLWRYEEWLPVLQPENRVSLGEGFTPLLPLKRLADRHGLNRLTLKDEGLNPTGSFKARGGIKNQNQ